jgi:hypothetical protein
MRHVRLVAIAIPVLLAIAACGGNQPSSPSSQASTQTPAPTPTTTAVSGPADPKALAPLYGTWALDLASCGKQVLTISAKRFEGPGSGCDIAGYTDNGDGTYTAAMSCTADGQTAKERISMRPIFGPTGEGIDLVYLDRKNLTSEVLRCPATK